MKHLCSYERHEVWQRKYLALRKIVPISVRPSFAVHLQRLETREAKSARLEEVQTTYRPCIRSTRRPISPFPNNAETKI